MDPGDSHRQRCRPRLFLTLWLLLLLLLQRLPPPNTMCFKLSGDSDFESHTRFTVSPHRISPPPPPPPQPSDFTFTLTLKMTVSSGMTVGHSQYANPAGRVSHPSLSLHRDGAGSTTMNSVTCSPLSSIVPRLFKSPLISAGFHRISFGKSEMTASLSSGQVTTLTILFQSRWILLSVERNWLNLHELDGFPVLGACFADFPGANHRQLSPTFDRNLHRLCAVSVTMCGGSLHTGLVSYGMILIPPRPPDELSTSISVPGGPPCTTNLRLDLNMAAQGQRAELGQTHCPHLGFVWIKGSISAHKPKEFSPELIYLKKGLKAKANVNGISASVLGNLYYLVYFLSFRHSELRSVVEFIVFFTIIRVVSSDRLKTRFSETIFVIFG